MSTRNIIGAKIKQARNNANPPVTQKDLAARLQLEGLRFERVTISKIEIGYREVTDVEIAAIAKSLGVTISSLFGENT